MLESQNTPASEDSAGPAKTGDEDSRPKSRQDKVDEIAKILEGNDGDADDLENQDDSKPAGQDEDSQKPVKPETLDAVAEQLGIDVSDLYEIAIKQPTGPDGEDHSITLGELADLAKDKGQFELDRIELDEDRRSQQAKFVRAQQQLNEIIGMLPKSAISEDLVNAVAAKMADDQKRERGLTLNAIREWSDEAVEASDRAAMQEFVSEYGFSSQYIESVHDHKTLLFIRDAWKRKQRMDAALAAMRKAPKRDQKPSKPAGTHKAADTKAPKAQRGPKGQSAKVAAVAELLRNSEG